MSIKEEKGFLFFYAYILPRFFFNMIIKEFSNLPLYQFESLAKCKELVHYVSGRAGGITPDPLGSLNLSFKVGDDASNVQENRKKLATSLGLSPEFLIFPDQTHSTNVKLISTGSEDLDNTDALITNTKGICISAMAADCVPVLLYDPVRKACAAIHSGWKGTVGKIVANTIGQMEKNFGSDPLSLVACIGPSICQDVYQVGPEVIREVKAVYGCGIDLIKNVDENGKGYLNLWEANRMQLIAEGVLQKNIEVAGICTYSNSDKFFSARKSKNNTGRFAAGIMLK